MVPAKKTLFYWIMREWCFAGSRVYFKKVETKYLEPLPREKPIIFVGNHCNTFIDPILISVNTRLYPAFLTTAAAFKVPIVAKFLHAIRMLPIYRQRDGGDPIRKNQEIFDISIQQLEANLQFVIFAEGSHSPFRRLREFKKGFARIGFDALEKHKGDIDVQIVPVGVEYRQFGKMHQEVTQTYGKAIPIKDYWEDYQKDKERALIKLKDHVYNDLKNLLIHIPTEKHYDAVESLRKITRPWLYDFLGLKRPGLYDMLLAEKQMIAAQTKMEQEQPEAMDSFAQKILAYQQDLDKLNFRNHLVVNGRSSWIKMILQFIPFLVFLPVFVAGFVTGYIPWRVPGIIAKKVFRDEMYHGAINYGGGLALFTLFWIIEVLLVQLIFGNGWITLAFALIMPAVAYGAFLYWIALKKWWHRWRFAGFTQRNNGTASKLKQQYDEIIQMTEDMITKFG